MWGWGYCSVLEFTHFLLVSINICYNLVLLFLFLFFEDFRLFQLKRLESEILLPEQLFQLKD